MSKAVSCTVCLIILILATSVFAEEVQTEDRMAALRAIEGAYYTNRNVTERAEKCLALLKLEMADPSNPTMGFAGGPIDSGYVQNVIIRSFFNNSPNVNEQERLELRDWAKNELKGIGNSDKALRERLILVIGHTGDKSVVSQLIDILKNHPEGHMRCEAAMALWNTDAPSSIPALKHALATDTYARVRRGGCMEPRLSREEIVYSPTRAAAARALSRLGVRVPNATELVDRKLIIPRLESMLYSNKEPWDELQFIAAAGGPEAESAILRYIDSKTNDNGSSVMADFAREMLERLKAADASK